ncbi:MAG: ribosome maturation factor RimM [Candidatus Binatia bacterium]
MAEPLVPLGEIVATHGLDGWLRLNPFNPNSDTLSPGLQVYLEKSGSQSLHELESSKAHKRNFLIKLRGVNHIDTAQQCVGSLLLVGDAALEALEPGQYYQYQVVGFEVFDRHGVRVGKISALMSTAGGELFVVQGEQKEHLIPAVKEIVEKVDFLEKKIIIDPPDGLLDL